MSRTREAALSAYAHQALPFESLVDDLQPVRSLSHAPLFQVMFVLQNTPAVPVELTGLGFQPLEPTAEVAKFDLTLSMIGTPHGLVAHWNYSTDLFEAPTVVRLAAHLVRLLEGAVTDPQRPVADLIVLSASERQALTVEWNATACSYRTGVSLHGLIGEQVERSPEAEAVQFEGASLSYGDLWERAGKLAGRLRLLGVGPEERVGVFAERSLELPVALLAVLRAGGAYVPLDPSYPSERLAFMAADAGIGVLLCQ